MRGEKLSERQTNAGSVLISNRFNRVAAIATISLCLLLAAGMAANGDRAELAISGFLGIIAIAVHRCLWRPAVIVDTDGVTIRNPVATHRIPWESVLSIDSQLFVRIATVGGDIPCIVTMENPGRGAFGVPRRRRRTLAILDQFLEDAAVVATPNTRERVVNVRHDRDPVAAILTYLGYLGVILLIHMVGN